MPSDGLEQLRALLSGERRRVARAKGKAFDAEGRLIAHDSGTCLILEARQA